MSNINHENNRALKLQQIMTHREYKNRYVYMGSENLSSGCHHQFRSEFEIDGSFEWIQIPVELDAFKEFRVAPVNSKRTEFKKGTKLYTENGVLFKEFTEDTIIIMEW